MKISVHVKILNPCMAVSIMSRSSHKIVHHFSMYKIAAIVESLVYNH
jgi:hypothetical protein